MVLIISSEDDQSTNDVIDWLRHFRSVIYNLTNSNQNEKDNISKYFLARLLFLER